MEFPSVWTNIHTYRPFKATRRGFRLFESPGSTLSPHNLSGRFANALRDCFFGGFLSFPTWDKNKYSIQKSVVKGKERDCSKKFSPYYFVLPSVSEASQGCQKKVWVIAGGLAQKHFQNIH
jgi:hypothetical protein